MSAIDESTREFWCQSQVSQCPLLCQDLGKTDIKNKCYPENLFYECVCTGNTSPNLTEYSQTIPYFQCTLDQSDCIKGCGAAGNDCSNQCKKTFKCGATDPKKANKTKTASASKASKTSSSSSDDTDDDGFGSAGDSDDDDDGDDSSDQNAAGRIGGTIGTALVALGVAAGAAFIGL